MPLSKAWKEEEMRSQLLAEFLKYAEEHQASSQDLCGLGEDEFAMMAQDATLYYLGRLNSTQNEKTLSNAMFAIGIWYATEKIKGGVKQ